MENGFKIFFFNFFHQVINSLQTCNFYAFFCSTPGIFGALAEYQNDVGSKNFFFTVVANMLNFLKHFLLFLYL